jgi:hypothetical protein
MMNWIDRELDFKKIKERGKKRFNRMLVVLAKVVLAKEDRRASPGKKTGMIDDFPSMIDEKTGKGKRYVK